MRRIILILILGLGFMNLQAQELKCQVSVNSSKVQGSNKQVFQTLQNAIFEFMNNRTWTDHVYGIEERIECNIMLNITDQISADEFKGTLSIQSRRPVFNTNYYTPIFNFVDKDLHFNYIEFEPLEFDLNSFTSNLTSILAYYAYYIIGLDYDSFSYEGGTPYFQKAEQIVNNAQNVPQKGWKPTDDMSHKNRYWLVKDMLDADYAPVREFTYRYHRHGLDRMDAAVTEGRAEVATALESLREVYRKRPDPYMHLLRQVFDAKADELSKMFTQSFPEEKNRVYTMLIEMDKTNTTKYKNMLEANSNENFR